jgi:hypothetical protein
MLSPPNYPPPPLPFFRAKARIPDQDYWLNALSDPRLSLFKHSYLNPEITNLYWYKRLNDMYKGFTRQEGAEQSLPPYDVTQDYKKVADFIRAEIALQNAANRMSDRDTDRMIDFIYWGTNFIKYPTLQSIVSEVWLYSSVGLDEHYDNDEIRNSFFFKQIYTPSFFHRLLPVPSRYFQQTISANRMKIYYIPLYSTFEEDISNGLLISSTINFQGTIIQLAREVRRAMERVNIPPATFQARLVDGELIVIVNHA